MRPEEKLQELKEICKDGVRSLSFGFYIGVYNDKLWLYYKKNNDTGPTHVNTDKSDLLETIYKIIQEQKTYNHEKENNQRFLYLDINCPRTLLYILQLHWRP